MIDFSNCPQSLALYEGGSMNNTSIIYNDHNEQITIKNKNRDSIEDITHFYSRDEIESIFSKYNDSEIAHNFNKMIINDMYNTVFDCKPLSRATKSDNIKEIRHLFYSIKRTKDMLQPL